MLLSLHIFDMYRDTYRLCLTIDDPFLLDSSFYFLSYLYAMIHANVMFRMNDKIVEIRQKFYSIKFNNIKIYDK